MDKRTVRRLAMYSALSTMNPIGYNNPLQMELEPIQYKRSEFDKKGNPIKRTSKGKRKSKKRKRV